MVKSPSADDDGSMGRRPTASADGGFVRYPLCLVAWRALGLSRAIYLGGCPLTTVLSSVEDDFYGWLIDQAAALKGQRCDWLHWQNLSEELQAAARSLEEGLESDLELLLTYLLRWHYQPCERVGACRASIQNARSSIADRLADSPRLARQLARLTTRAYRKARRLAGAAMNLTEGQWEQESPQSCPWDPRSFIRSDFWPEDENNVAKARDSSR
jgi:Domain of unknown function DUF29